MFWRQRSKQLWLQAGDKNTHFSHAAATERRRSNSFQKLQNEEEVWVELEDGLDDLLTSYFNQIFSATENQWEGVVDRVTRTITDEQNELLLSEVTIEEVKLALFQMHPDKAPGPDGMTPGFFQRHWSIVGEDIVKMVKEFFSQGVMLEGLNETNLVLIPKKNNPSTVSDLRPISLCNVLVKIITKVMANRMKLLLNVVISESQSAFIPGRLISDNILVSYEVMHFLKNKRVGKEGYMAIKLDMSKAYDRLEWGFLKVMLGKMGFSDHWVKLVMASITSVSYNIVHGDRSLGPIFPSRGIRQGDPLSPYLFIMCAEGLSALLRFYESNQWIHGVRVCRQAPSISHMLFADDSYLYCKATTEEASRVLELLRLFEQASGQRISVEKSSVFFSSNIIPYNRFNICQVLMMKEADKNSKYLGLPNLLGQKKSVLLGFLKDKLEHKIRGWERKPVSKAGQEILIKMVGQSLPTYVMGVFLLPMDLVTKIEKMLTHFWWNSTQRGKNKIHWASWEKLCKHKSQGGMDFRDFRSFNLAMLGKQGWRFLSNPESLVSRVYKAKYFRNGNYLDSKLGANPSFTWRSIWEARELVSAGACWKIGTGSCIDIVGQPWLANTDNSFVTTVNQTLQQNKVQSLMHIHRREWDREVVQDLFNVRDQMCILETPICADEDTIV